MPRTTVIPYVDEDGSIPLRRWLSGLEAGARNRCLARLTLLERFGHELGRPHAEPLEGTDLYELRVKFRRANLRMFCFFHERGAAIVSQGSSKGGAIPRGEIELAAERSRNFESDPLRHSPRAEDHPDG